MWHDSTISCYYEDPKPDNYAELNRADGDTWWAEHDLQEDLFARSKEERRLAHEQSSFMEPPGGGRAAAGVLPPEGFLEFDSDFKAAQAVRDYGLAGWQVVTHTSLSVPLEAYNSVTKYGDTIAPPSGEAVVVYKSPKIVDHAEFESDAECDTDVLTRMLTLMQVGIMKQGLVASGKRGKNKGKKQNRGRMPNVAATSRSNVTVINKLICNAETHVPIQYLDPTALRNNVGVSSCSWRYAVNNPFLVDPSVAATVPGRSYLAGLYNYCRVTHAKVRIVFTNNEAFNLQVGFFPLGGGAADPGLNNANVSASGAQQPLARSFELGAIGGQNRKVLTLKLSIPNWTGLPASATDDNYLSFGGLAPANLVYCPVYARTGAAGVVLVAGVTIEATVKMWCEWSGRVLVTT